MATGDPGTWRGDCSVLTPSGIPACALAPQGKAHICLASLFSQNRLHQAGEWPGHRGRGCGISGHREGRAPRRSQTHPCSHWPSWEKHPLVPDEKPQLLGRGRHEYSMLGSASATHLTTQLQAPASLKLNPPVLGVLQAPLQSRAVCGERKGALGGSYAGSPFVGGGRAGSKVHEDGVSCSWVLTGGCSLSWA